MYVLLIVPEELKEIPIPFLNHHAIQDITDRVSEAYETMDTDNSLEENAIADLP